MIARIGFAVGTLVALGVSTPAFAQDAPPFQRPLPGDSRFSILDSRLPESFNPNPRPRQVTESTTLSGYVRIETFSRDSSIEAFRARVNGVPVPRGDDTFVSADARIRLDLRLAGVRFSGEAAALPYDDGSNTPLGLGGPDVILRQLFIDLEEFPAAGLTLRAGAFDYAWKIRPHGEPFLIDLGRAESFFTGPADRDILQPGGALLQWRAGDFVEVEALWMTAVEGGPSSGDESLGAFMANFPLSERSAVLVGALHVVGSANQRVTTYGGGADVYFGPDRELELFGEAWMQSGRIASGVSKRAWGAQAGARVVADPWRAEASADWRSGDDDPADSRDRAFQSYEGRERFRIVESAEFGLDWDVNVTSLRLSVTRRIGDAAEARVDVGRFRMAKSMPGLDRDLGTEVDATVTLEISKAASAWLAIAALVGSDALESTTPDGESDALLVAAGLRALW